MMQLPNSKIAEALRRRKKGEFFEGITPGGGLSLAPFGSTTDVYTDESMKDFEPNKSARSSLDLDIDRPFNSGLDDTYRYAIILMILSYLILNILDPLLIRQIEVLTIICLRNLRSLQQHTMICVDRTEAIMRGKC